MPYNNHRYLGKIRMGGSIPLLLILLLTLTSCSIEKKLAINEIQTMETGAVLQGEVVAGSAITLVGVGFTPESDVVKLCDNVLEKAADLALTSSEKVREDSPTELSVLIPGDIVPGDCALTVTSAKDESAQMAVAVVLELVAPTVASGGAESEDTPQDTPPAEEAPAEEAPPPPMECTWSLITFEASPVYKSTKIANADQDLSTNLTWQVLGNCAPKRVIIKGPDGAINEFAGVKAQSGTYHIPELASTAHYTMTVIGPDNQQIADPFELDVQVIPVETDFTHSAKVENTDTGLQSVILLAPNYDQNNMMQYTAVFDKRAQKHCVTFPHTVPYTAPAAKKETHPLWRFAITKPLVSEAYALPPQWKEKTPDFLQNKKLGDLIGNRVKLKPGIEVEVVVPLGPSVTGTEECFAPGHPAVKVEGNGNYEVELLFKLEGSTTLTSYTLYKGNQIFAENIPLTYTISKPVVTADLAMETAPDMEYEVRFQNGARFAIATNANYELKIPTSVFDENADPAAITTKQPACFIGAAWGAPGNPAQQGSFCRNADNTVNQEFIDKMWDEFNLDENTSHSVYIYEFDINDMAKTTLNIAAKQFNPSFMPISVGYQNKVYYETMKSENIPAPNILESLCTEAKKPQIFGPTEVNLVGTIHGIKDLVITLEDLKGQVEKSPNYVEGDLVPGSYNINLDLEYDGMLPKMKFQGTRLIGGAITATCALTGGVKDWPIEVTMGKSEDCSSPFSNSSNEYFCGANEKKISLVAKIITDGQSGPRPFKGLRIDGVQGACDRTSDDTTIHWSEAEKKRVFTFDNYGLNCYSYKLYAKKLDDTWKAMTMKNLVKPTANWDGSWKWKTSSTGGTIMKLLPKLKFSWEHDHASCKAPNTPTSPDECRTTWSESCGWGGCDKTKYIKAVHRVYKGSGEYVVDMNCPCNRSVDGGGPNVSNEAKFENQSFIFFWNGSTTGSVAFDCSCTATGVDGQSIGPKEFKKTYTYGSGQCIE